MNARIIVAAALVISGCTRFNDALECDQEANQYRTKTIVQDQVCTTGRGIFGGLVTTCQAVPREAYIETGASRSYVEGCIMMRELERRYQRNNPSSSQTPAAPQPSLEQRAPGYAPTSHGWTVPPDVIEGLRPPANPTQP